MLCKAGSSFEVFTHPGVSVCHLRQSQAPLLPLGLPTLKGTLEAVSRLGTEANAWSEGARQRPGQVGLAWKQGPGHRKCRVGAACPGE